MKAIIKSLSLETFEAKKGDNKGKKFKKFVGKATVRIDEKGIIKDMRFSFSEDYGRRYFKYCGYSKISDLIGKECEVSTIKREWEDSEGNKRIVNEINYLHMLGKDDKPIYLPKDEDTDVAF